MATVGDKLVVAGGSNDWPMGAPWETQAGLSSVELYTKAGGWQAAGWSLPNQDYGHCIVSFSSSDELIYVSGVVKSDTVEVWKININTGERTALASPPGGAGGEHHCAQQADTVYVSEYRSDGIKVWMYSIADNAWTELRTVFDSKPQGWKFMSGSHCA